MKKIFSFVLAILIVCMSLPFSALGVLAESATPTFVVSDVTGKVGDNVSINISTLNNPGIVSLRLKIHYDGDILEYNGSSSGSFSNTDINGDVNPIIITWIDVLNPDNSTDGIVASLDFKIKDDTYDCFSEVYIEYDGSDVYNSNFENVYFDCVSGFVSVDPCAHPSSITEIVNYMDATCTDDGFIETINYCVECNQETGYSYQKLDAFGHNLDADRNCTNCGEHIEQAYIVLKDSAAKPGEEIVVPISVMNNPGLISMGVTLQYDSAALSLVDIESGDFCEVNIEYPTSDTVYIKCSESSEWDVYFDGNLAYLYFEVKSDAQEGEYPLTIKYENTDIYNSKEQLVDFEIQNSEVEVYYCDHFVSYVKKENAVAHTCVNDGSYDIVEYCDQCHKELLRETYVDYAQGHQFVIIDAVDGNCTSKGVVEHQKCEVCKKQFAIDADSFVDFDQALSDKELYTTYVHSEGSDGYCTICGEIAANNPIIYMENTQGSIGSTVDVTVNIKNNPGFISMKLAIEYDSDALELIERTAGNYFSTMAFGPLAANPFIANWVDARNPNNENDGVFVTLKFKIKEGATKGQVPLTITYDQEDVFDKDNNDIAFEVQNGYINILECPHRNTETNTDTCNATCTQNGFYKVVKTCLDCDAELVNEYIVYEATGHNLNEENICTKCGIQILQPTVVIGNVSGMPGDTVTVPVSIINNPGIVSIKLALHYDSNVLEVVSGTYGDFNNVTFGPNTANPFIINWVDGINGDNSTNGLLANITFRIKDNAKSGSYELTLSYDAEDIFNDAFVNVDFELRSGNVQVNACLHESIRTVIENRVEPTCTQDGRYTEIVFCNDCDTRLSTNVKYISCKGHNFTVIQGSAADCNNTGIVKHNHCEKCGKNFDINADIYAADDKEISIIIPITHNIDESGKCTVCGEYIYENPTIVVSNASGVNGKTVNVTISFAKNPGIVSSKLLIHYDSNVLELIGRTAGSDFKLMAFSKYLTDNPFVVNWVDTINPDVDSDGVFVTLTFKIKDDAPIGVSPITVTYNATDIFNYSYEDVYFDVINGGVEVLACEHPNTTTTVENNVLPTCTSKGGYDNVITCDDCGYSYVEHIVVPELSHTAGEYVTENYVALTCTQNGSYDKVVYCVDCNALISRTTVTESALGHKQGNSVTENTVESTCTVKGSYDLVVYCEVCNTELSRQTKELDLAEHTTGEVKTENRKESTCTVKGSYDLVTYCKDCNAIMSKQTVELELAPHTAGDAKAENRKESSCIVKGSYDSVVYCTVCDAEMSRETVQLDLVDHIRGVAVRENVVDSTCTVKGSYDEVIYCSVCNVELAREKKELELAPHIEGEIKAENRVESTCVVKGSYDLVIYCDICNFELSREKVELSLAAHTEGEAKVNVVTEPSCTNEGLIEKTVSCTVCNAKIYSETIKTAFGHKLDNDGKCTICNKIVSEPMFYVVSTTANVGKTFTVDVMVKNNPGIVSLKLAIEYDTSLFELVDAKGNGVFTSVAFGPKETPFYINWVDSINPDNTSDGVIATLTFKVKDDAPLGTSVISINYDPEDVFNAETNNVEFIKNDATVEIKDYTPGDVNGDNVVNNKDLGLLMQYLNNWKVEIVIDAADVTGDGAVNNKDYGLLMQYLNNWKVELK